MLAKLLWDPDADVEAIITDYCRAGFGPASEPVREYFRHLEEMTDNLAMSNTYGGRKKNPVALAQPYTDEFLAKCRVLLDEAVSRAGENEIVQQRIDFLRKAVEYARLRRDWTLAKAKASQGDREAAKHLQTIEAERDAWYRKLGISWVLNAAYLRYYGY